MDFRTSFDTMKPLQISNFLLTGGRPAKLHLGLAWSQSFSSWLSSPLTTFGDMSSSGPPREYLHSYIPLGSTDDTSSTHVPRSARPLRTNPLLKRRNAAAFFLLLVVTGLVGLFGYKLLNSLREASFLRGDDLGPELDGVYDIPSYVRESERPGDALGEYQRTLEEFIARHFPPSDSSLADPESLVNDMRSFFPGTSNEKAVSLGRSRPGIPRKLFQTGPSKEEYEWGDLAASRRSFEELNEGLNVTFHDDARADEWVHERFGLDLTSGKEQGNEKRGVVEAWNLLGDPMVLRSDFWRCALFLAFEGAVELCSLFA